MLICMPRAHLRLDTLSIYYTSALLFFLFTSWAPSVATIVISPAGKQHDWAQWRLPEGGETVEASHRLSGQVPRGIEVDPIWTIGGMTDVRQKMWGKHIDAGTISIFSPCGQSVLNTNWPDRQVDACIDKFMQLTGKCNHTRIIVS